MMLSAAARARRRSEWTTSRITWSFVYEWTVFMNPERMPKLRLRTIAVTDRQFVVQEPLLTLRCRAGAYAVWFTRMFTVTSSPLAGALIRTSLARRSRCLDAL